MLYHKDAQKLKLFISRRQQKIFALALYLIGGDRDRAYDIATSSFAEALRSTPDLRQEDVLLAKIAGLAVHKSRNTQAMPCFDDAGFADRTAAQSKNLDILRRALQKLPFEARALLLLRDQLNLPYAKIASIFKISGRDAKAKTIQSRLELRTMIEETLSRES